MKDLTTQLSKQQSVNNMSELNYQLHMERLDIYDATDIKGNTYPHDILRRFHNMIDIIMDADYPCKKENAELKKALKMAKKEMKMWNMELECERAYQEYIK